MSHRTSHVLGHVDSPPAALSACMMAALIVLAQEIPAVIVAVRRAHDNVDMVSIMILELWKGLAGLMIEFDDDDRTVNPIIENAVLFDSAAPGKMSVMKMPHDFSHFNFGVARPHTPDVKFDQTQELVVLALRQLVVGYPLVA